ncbi:DUF4149 domain-containing protein [Aquabacterium sp.]|uniref:DUF4149 domain-containing protein n=1 Tax=Aquabacterium sp. TaxID=1872578 RepID=UPI0025BA5732|nr:DUF4149 domain-containing protein [Aquabacterium sp.]
MNTLQRLQSWLAGLWAGLILGVGAISAPSLFAVLERSMAGQGAGRIFAIEARVSLALAIVIFLIERRRVRDLAEAEGQTRVMTGNLLLVLCALFLTVFGQFALHPMIEAAKAGEPTRLSFGALHGISACLFWLKGLSVLALAWRLTGARSAKD